MTVHQLPGVRSHFMDALVSVKGLAAVLAERSNSCDDLTSYERQDAREFVSEIQLLIAEMDICLGQGD